MFICVECKQKKKNCEQVFVSHDWCQSCVEKENIRSNNQDSLGGYIKSRPAKYMLNPKDYAKFGY